MKNIQFMLDHLELLAALAHRSSGHVTSQYEHCENPLCVKSQRVNTRVKAICAALTMSSTIFRAINQNYYKAERRPGRKSWQGIAKASAGIAKVAESENDILDEQIACDHDF